MLRTTLSGIDEVKALLQNVTVGGKAAVMRAIATYLIGDDSHGLKHYPNYKYVTRTAAYGQPFFSEAQRGFVMARIRDGTIVPGVENRSGAQKDWQMKNDEHWDRIAVTNTSPGIQFTQGPETQAAQPQMVGWRRSIDNIMDNLTGAVAAGARALQDFLESHGTNE